jgi:hypothetical protein
MTKELDEQLCEKYPKIFAQRRGNMQTTAMCWGFDCDDGWYEIIDALCSNLQWNTDNNNKDYVIENKFLRSLIPFLLKLINKIPGKYNFGMKKKPDTLALLRSWLNNKVQNYKNGLKFIYIESNRYPQVVASQVKEKFGGLCFYTNGSSDRQNAVISFVESLSYKVCERCGSMQNIGHTKGWIKTLCNDCGKEDTTWGLKK